MSISSNPSPNRIFWTHDETLTLIKTYKLKWISLNRGNLRASDWESVASTVSARSSYPKSTSQCRHKIEKLRRRYRSEQQNSIRGWSSWIYFKAMDRLENPDSSNLDSDEDDKLPMAVPVSLARNCEQDEEDIELRKKGKSNIPLAVPIFSAKEDEDEENELMNEKRDIPMGVPIDSVRNYNSDSNYEDRELDEQEEDIVLRKKGRENNVQMAVPIFSNGYTNIQQNYANQESNKQEEFEMRKKLKFRIPSINPNLNYGIQEADEQEEEEEEEGIEFKRKMKFKIPMAVPISKPNCNVSIGSPNFNSDRQIPTAVPIVLNQNSKTNQSQYRESKEDDVKFQFNSPLQSAIPIPNLNLNYRNEDSILFNTHKNYNSSRTFSHGLPLKTPSLNTDSKQNFSIEPVKRKRLETKERKGRTLMGEVAEELCKFGEAYMRMERRKMEMVRVMEKERMEMEMKRMKMIIDSHKMIMASIDQFERENHADS